MGEVELVDLVAVGDDFQFLILVRGEVEEQDVPQVEHQREDGEGGVDDGLPESYLEGGLPQVDHQHQGQEHLHCDHESVVVLPKDVARLDLRVVLEEGQLALLETVLVGDFVGCDFALEGLGKYCDVFGLLDNVVKGLLRRFVYVRGLFDARNLLRGFAKASVVGGLREDVHVAKGRLL